MATPEKGLQTHVVSKRNKINFVDDRQFHGVVPIELRDRA
jgi:hypothetical protein